MQVVMNKCFILNPEKNMSHIRLVVLEKNAKTANSDAPQFRKNTSSSWRPLSGFWKLFDWNSFRKPETDL